MAYDTVARQDVLALNPATFTTAKQEPGHVSDQSQVTVSPIFLGHTKLESTTKAVFAAFERA